MRLKPKLLFALVPALAMCSSSLLVADAIVSTGSTTVLVGSTFEVPVSVSGVSDLDAFQFDVSYDPTVLLLNFIDFGPFLPNEGTTTSSFSRDNTAGTGTFTADSLIEPNPGASGSGDIAILNFFALSTGTSDLTLSNVKLLDSSLNDIASTTTVGTVAVVVTLPVPEPNFLAVLGLMLASVILVRSKFAKSAT